MHGEHLGIDTGFHEGVAGSGQLGSNQHGQHTADQKEDQRSDNETLAHSSVIHGSKVAQAGPRAPNRLQFLMSRQGGTFCLHGRPSWISASTEAISPASCAISVNGISACPSPQNSAQTPAYSPGSSTLIRKRLTLPGTASSLPATRGTQNA